MFEHVGLSIADIQTINKNGQRFYKIDSDRVYPSITTILGSEEKPGLVSWRESLGVVAATKEMTRAATRGTAVHSMIEMMLDNNDNPTAGHKIEHINEFKSLRTYLNKINQIIVQEAALYSDVMKVAGRVDCIAEYNGKLAIIDFKTSTNSKNKNLITDYFLQTTAYAIMFDELYDIQINDVVIIMSVENGIPLVFHGKVDEYIRPLIERINTFHMKN
jgi:genome maintenance exonuclease 1